VETNGKTKFFSIKVSDDLMKVYLTVKPFAQQDIDISLNDVLQTLQSRSISFGIKEDVIKNTLDKVKQEKFSMENVLIAEGTQVINGEDGRLEFLFNINKKIIHRTNFNGDIIFRGVLIKLYNYNNFKSLFHI